MRKLRCLAAILTLSVLPFACDIQDNPLFADNAMVATLLSTPPVDLSPTAFASPDGGAGDAGTLTLPGQTAAQLFFGERDGTRLDSAPEPVSDATAYVERDGTARVALENDGAGNYSKTSVGDGALQYQEGASYSFTVEHRGESFFGAVVDAPPQEQIPELHPPEGIIPLAAGSTFTLTRPAPPAGKERTLGFVTVVPVGADGQKGQPTYSNLPKTPLAFLKLVAAPAEWKTDQVTLPGAAFPEPDRTYLISFQAARMGGERSDNLFSGSPILVGLADVGVVRTH